MSLSASPRSRTSTLRPAAAAQLADPAALGTAPPPAPTHLRRLRLLRGHWGCCRCLPGHRLSRRRRRRWGARAAPGAKAGTAARGGGRAGRRRSQGTAARPGSQASGRGRARSGQRSRPPGRTRAGNPRAGLLRAERRPEPSGARVPAGFLPAPPLVHTSSRPHCSPRLGTSAPVPWRPSPAPGAAARRWAGLCGFTSPPGGGCHGQRDSAHCPGPQRPFGSRGRAPQSGEEGCGRPLHRARPRARHPQGPSCPGRPRPGEREAGASLLIPPRPQPRPRTSSAPCSRLVAPGGTQRLKRPPTCGNIGILRTPAPGQVREGKCKRGVHLEITLFLLY